MRPLLLLGQFALDGDETEELMEGLKKYLGPAGYYWLGACAVYPSLQWNFTLSLGYLLNEAEQETRLDSTSLIRLFRLPWFRYAFMPDWLRIHLISGLSSEQEQKIRAAIQEILLTAIKNPSSDFVIEFARDYRNTLASLWGILRQMVRIKRDHQSLIEDKIFLDYMLGRPLSLAVRLPQELISVIRRISRRPVIASISALFLRQKATSTDSNADVRSHQNQSVYQNALVYGTLAGEVYEDLAEIRFSGFPDSEVHLFSSPTTDTQAAAIFTSDDSLAFIFRGTESSDHWKTSINFSREIFEFDLVESTNPSQPENDDSESINDQVQHRNERATIGQGRRDRTHDALIQAGFMEAYLSIREELHRFVNEKNVGRLVMTGHSLGGALATICAVDFALVYNDRYQNALYTFGSPRVGNDRFRSLANERIQESYRFVNGIDIIPGLPRWWNGYRHIGSLYRIGRRFTWRIFSARVTDHLISNYLDSLRALAKS
ncbi:MAG: lipase family protein [Chloroflexota bacterium]